MKNEQIMIANRNGNGKSEDVKKEAGKLLEQFVAKTQEILEDITALEVNTMVVSNITGAKFNAQKSYQEVYTICEAKYFEENNIQPRDSQGNNLHKRYKSLFAQLEREYFSMMQDENPELAKKVNMPLKQEQLIDFISKSDYVYQPLLPKPEEYQALKTILSNYKFVSTLRKISELKAALDAGGVSNPKTDTIYAQTVIQIDGDIITRYHKNLFEVPEDARNVILKAHNEGVITGEQQWRELLNFFINFVRGLAGSK